MQHWTSPSDTPPQLRPCVATFGNFDGVHRGHRAILDELTRQGRERDLPAVAVTFDPHPVEVMHPERAPEIISPGPLRDELLEQAGIAGLLSLPFTTEFAQTSAVDYVVDTFVTGLQAQALVVGADTRGFGAGYTGDVDLLRSLGEEHGFDVVVIEDQGETERWSSSAVRTHLAAGEVAEASLILGRPHRVVGTVVHGHHRGRELGYPTANLGADSLGLVPADGVYAGWLVRLDLPEGDPERRLPAAISVGTNPTFDGQVRVVESYVLDRTDLDLYGERVAVDFVGHVRPTLRFDSIDELLVAMARDVERTRDLLER
ncbi:MULTISPECIES: bifunctional riboflavin kinase/FAD synthetase [Janibacter]|uniref:Riboflavin biosynthesis protein n=1 Tax=Janibacter indicus TaxID=857417 RepID=A0A1L3MF55_9MICO|nr:MULTISPECIES: bifunctional riboflavin kinase/FAD synthetase [Janibacter]APH01057.1 bifunctional riboflavin kinase/FMN adenylyltransferase [Janibacter indicus]QNF95218.1 bifunctional riboflavin kinase/FAD synthetase [Janibacter sp. YB324]SMC33713.1 riboflavin kinase / FMN adenylyltransferase [Janibacter indicus]